MKTIKFRGKTKSGEWVEGSLVLSKNGLPIIVRINDNAVRSEACNQWSWYIDSPAYEVIPETVGQFRYENKHGKYFDGDIYYCAGFGLDVVSELCEITDRLMHGDMDDIGEIKGNIHDNPELLKSTEQ